MRPGSGHGLFRGLSNYTGIIIIPAMVLLNEQGKRINLPLATSQGNQIPNEQRGELARGIKEAAREGMRDHYPEARLRSFRSDYNCLGMVFANRRTWIDPEQLELILSEDGYRRVIDERELQLGDVVVYRNTAGAAVHVGIVTTVTSILHPASWEVWVLSQWGAAGEYFHRVDYVHPLLGTPSEYWTERI